MVHVTNNLNIHIFTCIDYLCLIAEGGWVFGWMNGVVWYRYRSRTEPNLTERVRISIQKTNGWITCSSLIPVRKFFEFFNILDASQHISIADKVLITRTTKSTIRQVVIHPRVVWVLWLEVADQNQKAKHCQKNYENYELLGQSVYFHLNEIPNFENAQKFYS